jgi:hypothetical protein
VRPRTTRTAIVLGSIGLIAAISLTPPGQAATGWVSRVVGLSHDHPSPGHIGGRPTRAAAGSLHGEHPEIVIAKGTAPGGSPYELAASTSEHDGTCFDLWFPEPGPTRVLAAGTCGKGKSVLGEVSVANSNGFGDSIHNGDGTWTSPALVVLDPKVARLRVEPRAFARHISAARVLNLTGKLKHDVGASHPLKLGLFFVDHPWKSPVRFEVTAIDGHGQVLAKRSAGAGPDGAWRGRG